MTSGTAVERFAESHMAELDYATECKLISRPVHGKDVSTWNVTVEAIPSATAKLVD